MKTMYELKAVHVGKQKILQDQIGVIARDSVDRSLAVSGFDHTETFCFQRKAGKLSRDRIILNNENFHRSHKGSSIRVQTRFSALSFEILFQNAGECAL